MCHADTVKNLGVIMDSKLTWKNHVEYVIKRVNRALFGLMFFRSSTTEFLRKRLANALVFPYIEEGYTSARADRGAPRVLRGLR